MIEKVSVPAGASAQIPEKNEAVTEAVAAYAGAADRPGVDASASEGSGNGPHPAAVEPGQAEFVAGEDALVELSSRGHITEGLVLDADFAARYAALLQEEEEEEEAASGQGAAAPAMDSDVGGVSPVVIVAGVAAVGGAIAIAAGGDDEPLPPPPPPPPPPPANRAPTFSGDAAFTGDEDTDIAFTLTATDPDGDTLTFSATEPANGVLQNQGGGSFIFVADPDFNGEDSFVVTVSDGNGGSAQQTVTITVTPVNDDPEGPGPISATTGEDAAVTINVAATDVDGDPLTFTASDPQNGTVTGGEGGQFTYTPDADFNGTDTFDVTVDDGNGGQATATVTVTVTANTSEVRSIDVGTPGDPVVFDANGSGFTLGDDFQFTDNADVATDVIIQNLEQGDTIVVTGATTGDYNFTAVGDDLEISFVTNGGVNNRIIVENVGASAGFIVDEATAEAVIGFDFFTATGSTDPTGDGSAVVGGDLDDDDDANPFTAAFTDAGDGDIAFTEDASIANLVVISNFGVGDTIEVSNGSVDDYSFTAVGDDVVISFLNGGVSNEIVLQDLAADATGIIDGLDDVEALLGEGGAGFFFAASGGGGGDPTATDVSIDVGVVGAPVTIDADGGAFDFIDDFSVTTEVVIENFGDDDQIVTNASETDYSFASDGNDLIIEFNTASGTNTIILAGVLNGDEFIADFATASAALGFDFMVFG